MTDKWPLSMTDKGASGVTKKKRIDPKKSRNFIFPKLTPKTYFESFGPQLPFCYVFFD